MRRVIAGQNRLTAPVLEEVLRQGLGDRAVDCDALDRDLAGDDGAEHAAHAVPEDEYLVGIHEAVLPHFGQRLTVRVELRLKVEVGKGPALAVTDPRLLHSHRHVAALGELTQDPAVRLRPAQRFVDRRWPQSLEEQQDRMSAGRLRPCDDGANPRRAADDVVVQHAEVLATISGTLLQNQRQGYPPAAAQQRDLEFLADRHSRDGLDEVGNDADLASVQGQENIPRLDTTSVGSRAGEDGFDQNTLAPLQLCMLSDLVRHGRQTCAEVSPARQLAVLLGRSGMNDGQTEDDGRWNSTCVDRCPSENHGHQRQQYSSYLFAHLPCPLVPLAHARAQRPDASIASGRFRWSTWFDGLPAELGIRCAIEGSFEGSPNVRDHV